MAILDHFGYRAHPLRDHDDPLWFDRDGFIPWLEHVKENKRLHMIGDRSVEGETNKKFQVTKKKIESKLKSTVKSERDISPEPSSIKRKSKPKKESGKSSKKAKASKGASRSSSSESEPEPEFTPGTKSRPHKAGKSPRTFSHDALKGATRDGSDIDTNSSETDGQ